INFHLLREVRRKINAVDTAFVNKLLDFRHVIGFVEINQHFCKLWLQFNRHIRLSCRTGHYHPRWTH
ncbi:MAG: hypothetical protein RSA20_11370, partial [Oscillospiraceae bacterium]